MIGKARRKRWLKWFIIIAVIGLLLLIGGVIFARNYYNSNLKPVSSQQSLIEVEIEPGQTLPEISKQLKAKKLIRNQQVFEQYVRNNGAAEDIKAGTYELSPSYGVPEIVSVLTQGKIVSKLVTILPGARIDQVEKMLTSAGYSEAVVKDALNPANYVDHPALVDKPADASLEGYLYPESFERTSSTTAKQIVTASLDEMQKRLTPEIRQAFTAQGLTSHRAIILASIVENEVSKPEERQQAAQVFLKRLKTGMMLQSNATDNLPPEYDTYTIAGLPPGPISNVTQSTLEAVAYPAQTDYLYFVSGKDCVTRFGATLEQHEANKSQHGIATAEDHCR
jgi:UPF0755 protein